MSGIFHLMTKRAGTPVESRRYGNVYLALSGLLFLGTMWAVVDEVSTRRPWKEYQSQYFELSESKWNERLNESMAAFDSAAYNQLKSDLAAAEAKTKLPEYVKTVEEIEKIDQELLDVSRDLTFAKSRFEEAYYFWKKSVHEGDEDSDLQETVKDLDRQTLEFGAQVDQLTAKRDSLAAILAVVNDEQRNLKTQIAALFADIDNARSKIEKARTSPILITQVMSNNFDRSNFGIPKARIDRCQTCHLGWKDEMMAEAPQPFTSHPVPELLKIHQPQTFGCTPCHNGQGPALTAGLAHGDADHYWEWPLLKGKEVYASCAGCHSNELHLPGAEQFNKGRQILSESGCFGCHEIKGFLDQPKIGPELNQLTSKTSPEWIFRWVRNPKDFNPHTRMPNFKFSDDQAEAITAFLMKVSAENNFEARRGISAGGDAARGETVLRSVGCTGCHVVGEDTRLRQARGLSFDVAPELSRAGSKLDPDWIFEWIKNPRKYRPATPMPNLRLSDQEARDIVAYLTTLKDDREFEQKSFSFDSPELAAKGEKLVREFGCAGCHSIKGMEREGRVSVALSNFGRKRVDELDFGDTKVPHTWDDWTYNKIKDARVYTTDRIVSKMPVFSFADSEIVALRTLLRGMVKEVPEPPYQRTFDARLQAIEAGRRLTEMYHCVNCHQIEEGGGVVKALLDDEGLAPPYLRPEGAKVQESWLHEFLKSPSIIRPWLNLRMPTFNLTDEEITTIGKYFLALNKQEIGLRDYASMEMDHASLQAGKVLFEDLQCLSCHYTGVIPEGKTPADLAPNLALAAKRLKPEWVLDWIATPDMIQPGTRMPSFYPDLVSPSPYESSIGDSVRLQIKALRDYVFAIGGKPTP